MSSFKRRDDIKINRLSSFLNQQGKLTISTIVPIKPNVFHIKTIHGSEVILKRHRNKQVVDQQWSFFDNIKSSIIIPFQRFPNGKKILVSNGRHWTIAPFIQGEKLNYAFHDDRIEGLTTLRNFHENAKEIYMSSPIKKQLFYRRWYNRLLSFKNTEHVFLEQGKANLYRDIVKTTESQLELITKLPWERLERKAANRWTWIHGDVAAHNFIRSEKMVYMIDFDLLARSPQLYDYIQLGQRFLPHLDWNLEELLAYNMVSDDQLRAWIYAIAVPSDVLREWLHFLSRNKSSSIHKYLTKMESEWLKRQDFLTNAFLLLK